MAKNQNTFEKLRREQEKKRKAQEKRERRARKKEGNQPEEASSGAPHVGYTRSG